jgi:hypothetical protein
MQSANPFKAPSAPAPTPAAPAAADAVRHALGLGLPLAPLDALTGLVAGLLKRVHDSSLWSC